jgi:ferredoxin-NADP reductase
MPSIKYQVVKNQYISPSVHEITLLPVNPGDQLKFAAGQYASISFRRLGRLTPARCFSIASSPTRPDVRFAMRVGGPFTKAVTTIREGDVVTVQGPFGNFVIGRGASQVLPVVFLAGGIGVTPFMSMIRFATEMRLATDIRMIYSSQNERDVPFARELAETERTNANLRTTFAITSGSTARLNGLRVKSGRITASMLTDAVGNHLEQMQFYICGPSKFMASMIGLLTSVGVSSDHIYTESFGRSAKSATVGRTNVTTRVYAATAGGLALSVAAVAAGNLFHTANKVLAAANIPSTHAQWTQSLDPSASAATPAPTSTPAATATPAPTAPQITTTQNSATTNVPTPAPTVVATPVATPAQVATPAPTTSSSSSYSPPVSSVS